MKNLKIKGVNYTTGNDSKTACENIRKELKILYPSIKFSVRKGWATHDTTCEITYTDGVRDCEIAKIVNKYAVARFDGMTDSREDEISDFNRKFGMVDWIHVTRNFSEKFLSDVETELLKNGYNSDNFDTKYNEAINTKFGELIKNVLDTHAHKHWCNDELSWKNFVKSCARYLQAPMEVKEDRVSSSVSSNVSSNVQLIDYSEKAIAITGDTKEIKEILKSLGGKFNPRLSCGAGWIFSKKVEAKVKEVLSLK